MNVSCTVLDCSSFFKFNSSQVYQEMKVACALDILISHEQNTPVLISVLPFC